MFSGRPWTEYMFRCEEGDATYSFEYTLDTVRTVLSTPWTEYMFRCEEVDATYSFEYTLDRVHV